MKNHLLCICVFLFGPKKSQPEFRVPFGLRKNRFLLVTLLVEYGRETKSHRNQQSNIIGSHTVSDTKYLFSQREKRRFAPSGSSSATEDLEFLR